MTVEVNFLALVNCLRAQFRRREHKLEISFMGELFIDGVKVDTPHVAPVE